MTLAECPHAAGQEPGMQHREKCQDQDSGELRENVSGDPAGWPAAVSVSSRLRLWGKLDKTLLGM